MHAYGGANLVPIAVPGIWCLTDELNSKYLFLRTNSAIFTRSSVGIDLLSNTLSCFLKTSKPSSCGMLWYNPTTSAVTRNAFSGIFPRFLSLKRKSLVSLTEETPDFVIRCRWWSRNSEAFSVGVLQFEITGRPGTLSNLLWIFGRRYILPKFVDFYIDSKNT